jgi:hypothetical protein
MPLKGTSLTRQPLSAHCGQKEENKMISSMKAIVLFIAVLLIYACSTKFTIPEGKEHITILGAELTPEKIVKKSLIKIKYKVNDSIHWDGDVQYVVAGEGLKSSSKIVLEVGDRMSSYKPKNFIKQNVNEVGQIEVPIMNDMKIQSGSSVATIRFHGRTTISLYFVVGQKRVSNVLIVPATFE